MVSWSDELHEDLPQLEKLSLVQTTPSMPTDAMPQMENLSLAQTTPSMLGTLIGEDPVDRASIYSTYENPKSATLKRRRGTKPFTRCVRVKLDHPPPPVLDDEDSEPMSWKKGWWR